MIINTKDITLTLFIKEIRKNHNPDLRIHRVEFIPSKKYLETYQNESKNISR